MQPTFQHLDVPTSCPNTWLWHNNFGKGSKDCMHQSLLPASHCGKPCCGLHCCKAAAIARNPSETSFKLVARAQISHTTCELGQSFRVQTDVRTMVPVSKCVFPELIYFSTLIGNVFLLKGNTFCMCDSLWET